MSLVENIVEQLVTSKSGMLSKPHGLNPDDMTFANLLEKQLQNSTSINNNNLPYQQMGVPSGMIIEPLDSTESVALDINKQKEVDLSDFEIKNIDIGDYFSNFLSDTKNYNSDIMKYAIKQASESYGQFNKHLASDLGDLLNNAVSIM